MGEKYIKIENLSVSKNLLNFINSELIPGIKIKKKKFWRDFSKYVHELAPKNKELLEVREKLQKKIDDWNKHKRYAKINKKQYEKFLKNWLYKTKVQISK